LPAPFSAIDHVQLAMPRGQEEKARAFYVEILGMTELPKPPELALRGGCWFASGDVQLHLGVEDDFRPARKAHPALRCEDFDAFLVRLHEYDVVVRDDTAVPGTRRAFVDDPFGNRIELVAAS
jgi:catechol 2,3-dioxygenase-like lactoylglutathione lyase family enzyme